MTASRSKTRICGHTQHRRPTPDIRQIGPRCGVATPNRPFANTCRNVFQPDARKTVARIRHSNHLALTLIAM